MKKEPKIISMGQIDLSQTGKFKAPCIAALPVIPTRNLVLFPGVALPIALLRESSLAVAQKAADDHQIIGLCCQIDAANDNPCTAAELGTYGVFVEVLQIFDLPDGTKSAFLRSIGKFKVHGDSDEVDSFMPGSVINLKVGRVHERISAGDEQYGVLRNLLLKSFKELVGNSGEQLPVNFEVFDSPTDLINNMASHIPAPVDEKLRWLAAADVYVRGEMLLKFVSDELQKQAISKDIYERAREEMSEEQRQMFLRRQMEVMQRDLYGDLDDVEELQNRAGEANLPAHVEEAFNKGIAMLRRLSPSAPDYSVAYNYLTTLLDMPWNTATPLSTSLKEAKEVLESEHYGMEKVKQRILEQVAVAIAKPDGKAPIICLVGAPGVGKTSLGESVARALGRNYQRVSLGGVSDEAEVRGHRRTYIGAMPGRIVDALRKAKSNNPLLLLDEIDKLSKDIKGDPSSALLEVLDPEQNCRFHDNYIDVDFDLSKVLFIATANTLDTIPRPLLDRMEVVEVPGYLLEEKIEIALRHLVPRVAEGIGLDKDAFEVTPEAVTAIVEGYTSESGVRQLEKALASAARKLLVKKLSGEDVEMALRSKEDVRELLGTPRFTPQKWEKMGMPGVVTGLAWTAHGGEILFVESSLSKGKGEKLTLTGNLGDVMKESATIALQYVKSNAETLGIAPEKFEQYNIHIHVPEGAVPKDGPSAGITMATSLASALTGRMVRPRLAMTGEITLRGRVMPVGGIKEKILAARRAGITDIMLSTENRPHIEDIEPRYLEGVSFHYVDNVGEVLDFALLP